MSGNPPRPGPGSDPNGFDKTLAQLRATVGCLEQLAPLDQAERVRVVVGLLGCLDDNMARLIAEKMGFKP